MIAKTKYTYLILISIIATTFSSSWAQDLSSCKVSDEPTSEPQSFSEQLATKGIPLYCTQKQTDSLFGTYKDSKNPAKEKKRKLKKLKKKCRKKARQYKRSVAKELLKGFKLKQALGAITKRTKNITKKNGVDRSESLKLNISLDISNTDMDLVKLKKQRGSTEYDFTGHDKKAAKERFSKYIIDQIRLKIPSIDQVIEESKKDPSNFSNSFGTSEVVPLEISVSNTGEKSCKIPSPKFPKFDDIAKEKKCESCTNEDFSSSFTNDCSYMVGEGMSNEKARELLGAKEIKENDELEDSHCNKDMSKEFNNLDPLKASAEKLCKVAQDGLVPDYTIETSRNMYPDKTNELASKRGEFTKQYIFNHLKDNCSLDVIPDWLSDTDSFGEKIVVKTVDYSRPNNKPGDYGPDPYAKVSEQKNEITYLEKSLDDEKVKIANEKKRLEGILEELTNQKLKLSTTMLDLKKDHSTLYKKDKGTINSTSYFKKQDKLTQLGESANQLYLEKVSISKSIDNIEVQIKAQDTKLKLKRFRKDNNETYILSRNLSKFYKSRDNHGLNKMTKAYKKEWDNKLFNQFKVARIQGFATKEFEYGIDPELMTPELKIALDNVLKVKAFKCELAPIVTKKTTFKGALSVGLKSILALPTLAVGSVAGLGIAAYHGIKCIGCGKPGKTIPQFFRNLGKKKFRNKLKNQLGEVVSWGGALDFESSAEKKAKFTTHDLDKFENPNFISADERETDYIDVLRMQASSSSCLDDMLDKEVNSTVTSTATESTTVIQD